MARGNWIAGLAVVLALVSAPAFGQGASSTTEVTPAGYQEGAGSYTGTWHTTSFAGAWGGTARYTTAASASTTFHCSSCQALAWVPGILGQYIRRAFRRSPG